MNIGRVLLLLFLFLTPLLPVTATEVSSLVLPEIQVVPIKDTQSKKQYELYIKLPKGYSESKGKQYPVIYYTDARWHVELLSASTEYIMEETILVGISWQKDIDESLIKEHGEHISRQMDYSVQPSRNPVVQTKFQLGQANNHLAFIRNDVIKTIESRYRADPDNRSYFGYSMGGLFGAYILVTKPETFQNYILGSPALAGDVAYLEDLSAKSNKISDKALKTNVFISHGTLEKDESPNIEAFIDLLRNRNNDKGALEIAVIEGNHQSAFPMTGVQSIKWLANLQKIDVKQ